MILESFTLVDKVALVTGAATGRRAAIAQSLAEAGASVACHGNSRSPQDTCDAIKGNGGVAYPLIGDLSLPETPAALIRETLSHFGKLDILINNAGTIRRAPAAEYSEADWSTV